MRHSPRKQMGVFISLLLYFIAMFIWIMHIQDFNSREAKWHYKQDAQGAVVMDAGGNPIKEIDGLH